MSNEESLRPLKLIYPTRRVDRDKATRAVMDKYQAVLDSLEKMSQDGSKTAITAHSLLHSFRKDETILWLQMLWLLHYNITAFWTHETSVVNDRSIHTVTC